MASSAPSLVIPPAKTHDLVRGEYGMSDIGRGEEIDHEQMMQQRENCIATYNIYKGIGVVFLLLVVLFLLGLKVMSSDKISYTNVFIPLYIYMSIAVLEGIGSGCFGASSDQRVVCGTFAGVAATTMSIFVVAIGIHRIETHARPDEADWSDLIVVAATAFFLYLIKVVLYGFYNCQKVYADTVPLHDGAIAL